MLKLKFIDEYVEKKKKKLEKTIFKMLNVYPNLKEKGAHVVYVFPFRSFQQYFFLTIRS